MIPLTATSVKKDNSNIRRCSDELWRALRKENFSKVRLDAFYRHMLVTKDGKVNPYPDCDFRMDIEKFSKGLTPDNNIIFKLFFLGLTPKEISEKTGVLLRTVYRRLDNLLNEFVVFYQED